MFWAFMCSGSASTESTNKTQEKLFSTTIIYYNYLVATRVKEHLPRVINFVFADALYVSELLYIKLYKGHKESKLFIILANKSK